MPGDVYDVRFRHTSGDIGPFKFSVNSTVQQLKDRLLAEWPTDGILVKERPTSTSDIRLILSGKFLTDGETLQSLRLSLGDPREDLIITMHVVVRPPALGKAPVQVDDVEKTKTCGCVIC